MDEPRIDLGWLIESVVEGREVDWESACSNAADGERRLLDQLRLVATIGSFANHPVDGSLAPFGAGHRWGTFELLERLGHGACGEVWRARDIHLDREVALKLLTDVSVGLPRSSAEVVLREGHLLSRVRHPNVVTVYGAARHEGRVGLWMECIEGQTLADQVEASGPFDPREAAEVGVELCRALVALHAAGLIHRDIKPQNIMREAGGRTVLMDLGVGIEATQARLGQPAAGTPLYLAPEVFASNAASSVSDLYSVGVLLFHLVSGRYPLQGKTLGDVAAAHRRRERVFLRDLRPDLPEVFTRVVERALEPDPSRRFESAADMERALVEVVDSSVARARGDRSAQRELRRGIAAAVVVVAMLAGVSWWAARDRERAASLRPLDPFQRRDVILVAAFENQTGDPSLNGALERALAHELRQSPHVVVASIQQVDDALRLMGRPVGTLLDRSVAREVALRDGRIRVVLAGVAEKVGSTYVLTVENLEPEHGTARHSLREQADSADSIVRAIGRLAGRIRAALGEPDQSVEGTRRQLEKVTTPSLQALKLYSEAYDAGSRELWAQSESLVRAALELEPEFPSALNWLGWSMHRQDKPPDHWLPYFQRAFELVDLTTDRERYFIAGSYLGLTGEFEQAISAYQALVRLHPDHAWGVNNLIVLLDSAGRRLEIADLLDELARARPDDLELIVRASVEALAARGLDAARPHVARARVLLERPPGPGPRMAFHSLWLALVEAHEHWLAGRAHEATAALAAAMSSRSAASASPDMRSWVAGSFHLALGQVNGAKAWFDRISNAAIRGSSLALLALVRGDAQEVSSHLADYEGRDGLAALLLARAGYSHQAQRLLDRIRRSTPGGADPAWDGIRAEVDPKLPASWRIAALRRVVEERPVAWDTARYYLHAESLAALLHDIGDPTGALRVLETASTYRDRAHRDPVHIGYFWMRLQMKLADAYRQAGRETAAERIEADLVRMLAAADQDFPLLVELQTRTAGPVPR